MRPTAEMDTILMIAAGATILGMALPVANTGSYVAVGFGLLGFLLIAAACIFRGSMFRLGMRWVILIGALAVLVVAFNAARAVYRLSHFRETQQALLLEKQNIEQAIKFFRFASNSDLQESFLPIEQPPEAMPPPPLEVIVKVGMGSFRRSSSDGQQRLVLEYGGTEAHFGYDAIFVDELEPGKQTMILSAVIETKLPILLYIEKDEKKVFLIGDELAY